MTNITNNQTTNKVNESHEAIPNEGPATYVHPAVYKAKVERDTANIAGNRNFWDKINPPRSKRPLAPAKIIAGAAALAAAGTLAAVVAPSERESTQPTPAEAPAPEPQPSAVRIVETRNGAEARISVAPEDATAAQRYDAQVKSGTIQPQP